MKRVNNWWVCATCEIVQPITHIPFSKIPVLIEKKFDPNKNREIEIWDDLKYCSTYCSELAKRNIDDTLGVIKKSKR